MYLSKDFFFSIPLFMRGIGITERDEDARRKKRKKKYNMINTEMEKRQASIMKTTGQITKNKIKNKRKSMIVKTKITSSRTNHSPLNHKSIRWRW